MKDKFDEFDELMPRYNTESSKAIQMEKRCNLKLNGDSVRP